MFFRMIYDESLAQAAYLIGCQQTGEAIVVDPERDVDRYISVASANKLRITAVTETHIHADFLSGARELAEKTGATVYVSDEGDVDWKYGWVGEYPNELLKDGDDFLIGRIRFSVRHTPGHTPEHISFLVTDTGGGAEEPMGALTGDFVFVGALGRPDLLETAAGVTGAKESAARELYQSALDFMKWDDFLQVWPAHGAGSACGKALGAVPQSTVGYEKRFNPSLVSTIDEASFVEDVLSGQVEPPLYFARMKRENRDGPKILGELPNLRELSALDLLKIEKNAVVLDTRSWGEFKAGHLPGSLFTPFGSTFPTVAGTYVEPRAPIFLVIESGLVDEAVRCLVRVGLDNVHGFVQSATLDSATAEGVKLSTSKEIDIDEFAEQVANGSGFVLDVRRATEFEAGHIADAANISHVRLAAHLNDLPKDQPILVHCQLGGRSAIATALLERHGFDATNIAGGYAAWARSGKKTVRDTAHVV